MKRRTPIALIAAAALAVAACGDDDSDDNGGAATVATDPSDPTEIESDETDPGGTDLDDGATGAEQLRSDAEPVDPPADAPLDEVVAGSNQAGFELLRELGTDENLVLSPASVTLAFGMAGAGAGDEATWSQLADAFGWSGEFGDEDVHEAMNALLAELELENEGVEPGNESELNIANSGWAQDGAEAGDEFLDVLAGHYDAGLYTVDFAGDGEAAQETINQWVADATNDRIDELLEGPPDPSTVYMLINAIYLQASWEIPFPDEQTEDGRFTLADGSTVDVSMMQRRDGASIRHEVSDQHVAASLPYADGELTMNIVMPTTRGGLSDYVEGLDAESWRNLVDGLEQNPAHVTLPSWETDSQHDLAGPLGALGLEIPGGDFSGVAPGAFIDDVLQAANITVNEAGTEAAAATSVAMAVSAPADPSELVFDQPFFYTIEHEPTGLVLFAGQMHDPS